MEKNYFHPEHILELQKDKLSEEEILKGNRLFLKFMDLDDKKTDEWVLKCALYDRSFQELMMVALRIDSFWTEEGSEINAERFNFRHLMFHQVMNFNFLYRRCMDFVEKYYNWLTKQQSQ